MRIKEFAGPYARYWLEVLLGAGLAVVITLPAFWLLFVAGFYLVLMGVDLHLVPWEHLGLYGVLAIALAAFRKYQVAKGVLIVASFVALFYAMGWHLAAASQEYMRAVGLAP